MAAAVSQFCRSWLMSPHAVVAARVLASSPASMTIEYVLSTICYQLSEVRATVSIPVVCLSMHMQKSKLCSDGFPVLQQQIVKY